MGFSFGYNRNEDEKVTLSPNELIDTFVDIVSKNGNLLLAVGPTGDGSIPDIQVQRLKSLGKRLQTNGEGIYGTRPWVTAEGETEEGVPLRFTQKEESLHIFILDRPANSRVHLKNLYAQGPQTRISLLGGPEIVEWEQEGANLVVTVPTEISGDYAHALKVTPKPWKMMR